VATIEVGDGPEGLLLDGSTLWVALSEADAVARIDTTAGEVIETLDVGGAPRRLVASGDDVSVVNTRDGTLTRLAR
jgi:YVTN family beta-propeller protein